MTIKITRSELLDALRTMSPFLAEIMSIRINEKNLEMFAYKDGNVLARIPFKGAKKDVDWMHIDGVAFQQLVGLADEGIIEINFTDKGFSMLHPCSVSEFRSAPTLNWASPANAKFGNTSATIKGKDLSLLSTMTEAASTDDTRPNLQGIHIAAEDGAVKAAAADGYILSFTTFESSIKAKGSLYSVKALNRAKRAIKPADDEDVSIGFHKDGISLSVHRGNADFFIEVPRLEGNFPDYMAIVKGVNKTVTVKVETKTLDLFLKRANAIQDGHIYMQALNGNLWMMATNNEKEKSLDSAPVETGDESVVMHYSVSLLKDVLKACAANGHVTLNFPEKNNAPMLINGMASVIAMPLVNELKESPFKDLQPTLI